MINQKKRAKIAGAVAVSTLLVSGVGYGAYKYIQTDIERTSAVTVQDEVLKEYGSQKDNNRSLPKKNNNQMKYKKDAYGDFIFEIEEDGRNLDHLEEYVIGFAEKENEGIKLYQDSDGDYAFNGEDDDAQDRLVASLEKTTNTSSKESDEHSNTGKPSRENDSLKKLEKLNVSEGGENAKEITEKPAESLKLEKPVQIEEQIEPIGSTKREILIPERSTDSEQLSNPTESNEPKSEKPTQSVESELPEDPDFPTDLEEGLEEPESNVDVSELNKRHEEHERLDRELYTNHSLIAYDEVIYSSIDMILHPKNYSQQEVDNAFQKVIRAKNNLVIRADTTEIETLMSIHEEQLENHFIAHIKGRVKNGLSEDEVADVVDEIQEKIQEIEVNDDLDWDELDDAVYLIESEVSSFDERIIIKELDSFSSYSKALEKGKNANQAHDNPNELRNNLIAAFEQLINDYDVELEKQTSKEYCMSTYEQ